MDNKTHLLIETFKLKLKKIKMNLKAKIKDNVSL